MEAKVLNLHTVFQVHENVFKKVFYLNFHLYLKYTVMLMYVLCVII